MRLVEVLFCNFTYFPVGHLIVELNTLLELFFTPYFGASCFSRFVLWPASASLVEGYFDRGSILKSEFQWRS